MNNQITQHPKPQRKPYQKPRLELRPDWKLLTGAPISVPITDGLIDLGSSEN